ncbi:hypothetical protein MPSEU_000678700 [Mayamaea pseudoterrestris]|nr:hypothetical protein MPSEU_000678700 [Mayamaea pseudoterrestris]
MDSEIVTESISEVKPPANNAATTKDENLAKIHSSHSKQSFTTPIACVFAPEHDMFRVTRSKGNTLFSGGYGVSIPINETSNGENNPGNHTFLFIEEVVVLYKQGLLKALDENGIVYERQQLYDKLHLLGVSWPAYLVYAHLRMQTYRVVRHTPTRRAILQEMQTYVTAHTSCNNGNFQTLKRQLRLDAVQAVAPRVAAGESTILPAFDVYQPNSRFAKSCPGLPDFSIAITSYHHCQVHYEQWHALVSSSGAAAIPVKIAAVSDSGTVLVFGVTNTGVPTMATKSE